MNRGLFSPEFSMAVKKAREFQETGIIDEELRKTNPAYSAMLEQNMSPGTDQGSFAVPTFSGKHQASQTWAFITKNRFADYKNRFYGLEDDLVNQTTYNNPGLINEEIGVGQQRANQAIDTSLGIQREINKGYGTAISQDQRQVNSRQETLTRSTSMVDAANNIRQRLVDRNRDVALGAGNTAVATMK